MHLGFILNPKTELLSLVQSQWYFKTEVAYFNFDARRYNEFDLLKTVSDDLSVFEFKFNLLMQ